jgi:beta-glucosidase
MQCSKNLFAAFLFAAGLVFPSQAQLITISGTVKNAGSQGIAGATVHLNAAKRSAVTDAAGYYSFGGAGINPFEKTNTIIKAPGLRNSTLYFGIAENSQDVSIELLTLTGRRVRSLVNQNLPMGNYQVTPLSCRLSSQLYFIRIQIGKRSTVLRLPLVNRTRAPYAPVLRKMEPAQVQGLAKAAAVADTMVVSAPGYQIVQKAVDAYAGTHDFVLEASSFALASPANGAMMCDSHKVALSWNAAPNAVTYEVWLNISRSDYDWMAPGRLLDRFTKIMETSQASCTTDSLPDRWTYKWYVVSVDASGKRYKSDTRVFSVYIPTLEQVDDNIPLISKGAYQVRDLDKDGQVDAWEDWKNPVETRVDSLMARMTLHQKTLQMFYAADVTPEAGWLMGPQSPDNLQKFQVGSAKTPLGIPHITASDCVHGYGNAHPTQSGLAAARDLDLVYRCASMQREEQVVCGARGTLSPLAEVGTKVLYNRIQEGNGENAEFAAGMVRALHAGYNGGPELNPNSILTNTKHWPGEGAGGEDTVYYDSVSIKYGMIPWTAAIEAGVEQIMPGYAKCPFLDPTNKWASFSKPMIDYLRTSYNYDGLTCGDWMGSFFWVLSAMAGVDVMGGATPSTMGEFENTVPEETINTACRRILRVKFKLGIFEDPYKTPALAGATMRLPEHKALCEEAGKKIMTLLKNDGILPLSLAAGDKIVVAGPRANDGISYGCWQSRFNRDLGGKTVLDAVKEKASAAGATVYHDSLAATHQGEANIKAAVCVVGEGYYSNVHGTDWPVDSITLPDSQMSIIKAYKHAGVQIGRAHV